MKAAVLHRTGDLQSLDSNLAVEETKEPDAEDGRAIVRVEYASLNRRDVYIAQGLYSKIKLPVIPGSDCSGLIYSVPDGTSEFKPGDEVIIDPSIQWGDSPSHQSARYSILGMPMNGTFAEFVSADLKNLHLKPSHLSHREASAIPLAGVTAYRALFTRGRLSGGENILITGIGGGVAALAMQFALSARANVFVTSGNDEKLRKAVELGAKGGALYTTDGWENEIREMCGGRMDMVLDSAGGDSFAQLPEIVSYGGRIVLYGASLGPAQRVNLHRFFWKQLDVLGSTMGSPDDFANMLKFVEERKIVPVIDSEYRLSDITSAYRKMNDHRQFGKIVVMCK